MDKIAAILAEVLDLDQSTIRPETRFRELENWDSLAALGVISGVADEFQVNIPPDDFTNINTASELLSYLKSNAKS